MIRVGAASILPVVVGLCGMLLMGLPTGSHAQEAQYVAPRSAVGDGTPDLNGIWQAVNTAHWNLLSHPQEKGPAANLGAMFFVPPGRGVVVGDEIPYLPAAADRRRQNFEERIRVDHYNTRIGDPELKCYMPGIPRATYMPYPFQILQGVREILFVYQFAKASRIVHMDERVESLVDTWMGVSNGHWEGDTLVIEVTGFNGRAWLDRSGNHVSRNARVIERYTPMSPWHLLYEATIEDPDVFTRPWSLRMPLYRIVDEGAELLEVNCVELSEEALYGDIRSLTEDDFDD